MPLSTVADAKTFAREGFIFRPLAVPSRGSTELAVWTLEMNPGAISETHSMDREEVFVVVTGAVSATVGDEEISATTGDAIIVPAHTVLQIRNTSPAGRATCTAVTLAGMKATVGGATFTPPWSR